MEDKFSIKEKNRIKNIIWDGSMNYDSEPFITG